MTATCIIYDYVHGRRTALTFTEADFKRVNRVWHHSDRLLFELQANIVFKDRLRWCDLESYHYGLLITKNLHYLDDLTTEQQGDERHPTVRSLQFLLMCLARSIETRTNSTVDMLYVNRIAEFDVRFNYGATLDMVFERGTEPSLQVVVDNTREGP